MIKNIILILYCIWMIKEISLSEKIATLAKDQQATAVQLETLRSTYSDTTKLMKQQQATKSQALYGQSNPVGLIGAMDQFNQFVPPALSTRDRDSSQRSFLLKGSDREKQPLMERVFRIVTKTIKEQWPIIRLILMGITVLLVIFVILPAIAL